MITRASSRSVPIVLLMADLVLCTLEKTLSGSQEVMGRVTNNSKKFLTLGKLSVLLRADMARLFEAYHQCLPTCASTYLFLVPTPSAKLKDTATGTLSVEPWQLLHQ